MNQKPQARPDTKPLFLALHPPRRVWPDTAGFYLGPARNPRRSRG